MASDRRANDNQEKVKLAVKEALDDRRMEDLSKQITDIATQLTKGFAEVHTRQDTTNGKVLKNSSDIEVIKSASTGNQRYANLVWLLITTLVGLVVFFITKH